MMGDGGSSIRGSSSCGIAWRTVVKAELVVASSKSALKSKQWTVTVGASTVTEQATTRDTNSVRSSPLAEAHVGCLGGDERNMCNTNGERSPDVVHAISFDWERAYSEVNEIHWGSDGSPLEAWMSSFSVILSDSRRSCSNVHVAECSSGNFPVEAYKPLLGGRRCYDNVKCKNGCNGSSLVKIHMILLGSEKCVGIVGSNCRESSRSLLEMRVVPFGCERNDMRYDDNVGDTERGNDGPPTAMRVTAPESRGGDGNIADIRGASSGSLVDTHVVSLSLGGHVVNVSDTVGGNDGLRNEARARSLGLGDADNGRGGSRVQAGVVSSKVESCDSNIDDIDWGRNDSPRGARKVLFSLSERDSHVGSPDFCGGCSLAQIRAVSFSLKAWAFNGGDTAWSGGGSTVEARVTLLAVSRRNSNAGNTDGGCRDASVKSLVLSFGLVIRGSHVLDNDSGSSGSPTVTRVASLGLSDRNIGAGGTEHGSGALPFVKHVVSLDLEVHASNVSDTYWGSGNPPVVSHGEARGFRRWDGKIVGIDGSSGGSLVGTRAVSFSLDDGDINVGDTVWGSDGLPQMACAILLGLGIRDSQAIDTVWVCGGRVGTIASPFGQTEYDIYVHNAHWGWTRLLVDALVVFLSGCNSNSNMGDDGCGRGGLLVAARVLSFKMDGVESKVGNIDGNCSGSLVEVPCAPFGLAGCVSNVDSCQDHCDSLVKRCVILFSLGAFDINVGDTAWCSDGTSDWARAISFGLVRRDSSVGDTDWSGGRPIVEACVTFFDGSRCNSNLNVSVTVGGGNGSPVETLAVSFSSGRQDSKEVNTDWSSGGAPVVTSVVSLGWGGCSSTLGDTDCGSGGSLVETLVVSSYFGGCDINGGDADCDSDESLNKASTVSFALEERDSNMIGIEWGCGRFIETHEATFGRMGCDINGDDAYGGNGESHIDACAEAFGSRRCRINVGEIVYGSNGSLVNTFLISFNVGIRDSNIGDINSSCGGPLVETRAVSFDLQGCDNNVGDVHMVHPAVFLTMSPPVDISDVDNTFRVDSGLFVVVRMVSFSSEKRHSNMDDTVWESDDPLFAACGTSLGLAGCDINVGGDRGGPLIDASMESFCFGGRGSNAGGTNWTGIGSLVEALAAPSGLLECHGNASDHPLGSDPKSYASDRHISGLVGKWPSRMIKLVMFSIMSCPVEISDMFWITSAQIARSARLSSRQDSVVKPLLPQDQLLESVRPLTVSVQGATVSNVLGRVAEAVALSSIPKRWAEPVTWPVDPGQLAESTMQVKVMGQVSEETRRTTTSDRMAELVKPSTVIGHMAESVAWSTSLNSEAASALLPIVLLLVPGHRASGYLQKRASDDWDLLYDSNLMMLGCGGSDEATGSDSDKVAAVGRLDRIARYSGPVARSVVAAMARFKSGAAVGSGPDTVAAGSDSDVSACGDSEYGSTGLAVVLRSWPVGLGDGESISARCTRQRRATCDLNNLVPVDAVRPVRLGGNDWSAARHIRCGCGKCDSVVPAKMRLGGPGGGARSATQRAGWQWAIVAVPGMAGPHGRFNFCSVLYTESASVLSLTWAQPRFQVSARAGPAGSQDDESPRSGPSTDAALMHDGQTFSEPIAWFEFLALVICWLERGLFASIFVQTAVLHHKLITSLDRNSASSFRTSPVRRRAQNWSDCFWREIKLIQLALLVLCILLRAGDNLLDQTIYRLLILSMATNMSARKMTAKSGVKQLRLGDDVAETRTIATATVQGPLCTEPLCGSSKTDDKTLGTMVQRAMFRNNHPFAFGPGSPARQGARHE